MNLTAINVWVERNTLVAAIWIKGESGEMVTFQQEHPIKIWEKLLDKEALTGLYSLELTMICGGVFYE